MRILTVASFAALLGPFLASASAQDEAAEMKWTFAEGDKFDLKWAFSETRKREPGRGEVAEGHDKRDVDAELSWKAEGILTLTLKKVVWSYGTQDYEVALMYVDGKKLDPQQKMNVGPTSPNFNAAKADADRLFDYMKKLTEGEFTVDTITEKGKTLLQWNGSTVRTGNLSLFDKVYTHPMLPSGPVRVGQLFKDPLEVTNLQAGLIEVKTVESKVTAVGEKGLVAKGGVNLPFSKTFVANGVTQTINGNFTYTCEWNFSPKQYLQGAREESKLTKKVDGKGKDANFYKENFTHLVSQALSIKKKELKPGEEKKPEEKKPEEKK